MSIETAVLLMGAVIACFTIKQCISEIGKKTHYQRALEEQIKRIREQNIASMEKNKKRGFITQFIDEIPELSYYEAAQLKKKLGNIYLEWNDE